MKSTLALIALFMIVSCVQSSNSISNIPLLNQNDHSRGGGPWQIKTKDNKTVTYYEQRVFLTINSQFVLSDGSPIHTVSGSAIYLNNQNIVINNKIQAIPLQEIFELNKLTPLPNNTPLVLNKY